MKNYHSIRYYEKRLYKLQAVADSIGYNIDGNRDYIRATALLPLSVEYGGERGAIIPAAFFRHYGAACEAVEMAGRVLNRRKGHYKARHGLAACKEGSYTSTKQKPVKGH